MSSLLIQNVRLHNDITDIFIDGNRFCRIEPGMSVYADHVMDGTGKAAVPPFYNTHTHAAMTLLRGYADDMELFTWLQDYIWPVEGRLTEEDVYTGTQRA